MRMESYVHIYRVEFPIMERSMKFAIGLTILMIFQAVDVVADSIKADSYESRASAYANANASKSRPGPGWDVCSASKCGSKSKNAPDYSENTSANFRSFET